MKKILVIDDDEDITFIVEMALAEKYIIKVRNDTKNLIGVIEDFLPNIILLDNYVGNKLAQEIVAEIRKHEAIKDIPLILFSAHDDIAKLAENVNASAFLPKPFELESLYSTIENILVEINSKSGHTSLHNEN
jgi:DNA-binding NtrC family response regulator